MSKLTIADTPALHKTQTLHFIKGLKPSWIGLRYFLSQAPFIGGVFFPDVQAGRGLGREGEQGESSRRPWGCSRTSQRCSLSAAGGEGVGIPRAEGWFGNPSPSLGVLVHGAVSVCSDLVALLV